MEAWQNNVADETLEEVWWIAQEECYTAYKNLVSLAAKIIKTDETTVRGMFQRDEEKNNEIVM